MSLDQLHGLTKIDPWFLAQIEDIVLTEKSLVGRSLKSLPAGELRDFEAQGLLRPSPGAPLGDRRDCGAAATPHAGCPPRCSSASTPARPSSRPAPPTCIRATRTSAKLCRRTARRSWSSVAVLTGSARASNSTTAASMLRSHCARTAMRRSWSTATRDGLDRLRHVRSPVFRAGHARRHPRDRCGRTAGRRDRPVRRPDSAQACA